MNKPNKDIIENMLREAGVLALEYFHQGVTHTEKSGPRDWVTPADHAVSDFLIQKIEAAFPDHAIHSEERSEDIHAGADWEWVIDPIDGTHNFANQIPFWCMLLAVQYKGETLFGAVYNPVANEFFFAEKGKGATKNGKLVRIPDHVEIEKISVHFQVSKRSKYNEQFVGAFIKFIEENKWTPKRMGCMLPMANLADGSVDAFMSSNLADHDVLAPKLIVEEAGGVICDYKGDPWQRGVSNIIVTHPDLKEWALAYFK